MSTGHRDDRLWLLAFLVVAAVFTTFDWPLGSRAGGFTPAAKRTAVPSLEFEQTDGRQWRLADHRGEVVLVNYWATWCGPCRVEMPGLIKVARESGPKGLAVVGVSLDEGPTASALVQQFASQYKLPYPVAFEESVPPGPRSLDIPTTVLIDRQGRIAKVYTGSVRPADFAKDVASLLAES